MPSPLPSEAANHHAMAVNPTMWTPPGCLLPVMTATGTTLYRPTPEPRWFPMPAQGELAKAAAQTRAKAAASKSRTEDSWAR